MPLASPPSQLVTGTHSVLPRRNTTCALDTHPGVHRELQSRLLAGLAPSSADRAAEVLARATTVEIEPGKPYFPASFSTAVLLVVEEGFVVVRATFQACPGLSSPARRAPDASWCRRRPRRPCSRSRARG